MHTIFRPIYSIKKVVPTFSIIIHSTGTIFKGTIFYGECIQYQTDLLIKEVVRSLQCDNTSTKLFSKRTIFLVGV